MSKIYYLIFGIFASIVILSLALFAVDQRQFAVIFQFGEAVRVIDKAGLNIKIPFIQTILPFFSIMYILLILILIVMIIIIGQITTIVMIVTTAIILRN